MGGPVFLSFCHEHDAAYAGRLAVHLASAGIATLRDTQPMSEQWWGTYTRAQLDACSAVVVVMTPEAARSAWVAREIGHARMRRIPIVPLLLRGDPWASLTEEPERVTGAGLPGGGMARRLQAATGSPQPQPQPQPQASSPAAATVGGSRSRVPLRGGATGLPVGIETAGGSFTTLVERGCAVPCELTVAFTTAEDDQAVISIRVYQGDGTVVADNQRIGAYQLILNERSPRTAPDIRVTFRVDADGVFQLTAVDAAGRAVRVASLPDAG